MRSQLFPNEIKMVRSRAFAAFVFRFAIVALFLLPGSLRSQTSPNSKLPRPRALDEGISLQRDPATGELKAVMSKTSASTGEKEPESAPHAIRVETPLVPVTCSVTDAGGAALAGLTRADFRIYDNGVAQPVTYFDAST
ncbi:MAG TPA: hypothetical protein VN884_02315, partial [Candidatus Sulfotelmatobacter sp.]|nr:hypothetical protein [Candidatus Sulfotelmatobacter sp.]